MVNIKEAASILKVSPDTIRRRIKSGALKAEKVTTAQGDRWQVEVYAEPMQSTQYAYVTALEDRITSLEKELDARRIEVQQLHSLLNRKALSPGTSFWQRLFRR